MTVNTKSPSRLFITGAALIAAPAIVVASGVIPRGLADTAAAAFRVHVVFAAVIVLALVVLSFRAAARPKPAAAVSQVLGAIAIILGMCLAMAGSAFLGDGPRMRVAVALLFSSAAVEFLAGVLVILAASRLAKLASESEAPGKAPGWKSRLLPAILLSVCSFFLMFLLGEFMESRSASAGAERLATVILIAGMGGYFLLASYFLLRRLPRSGRNLLVLLALNAALLLTVVLMLVVERNRTAVLQMLGLSLLAIACSAAGLGLAYRSTRLHGGQS